MTTTFDSNRVLTDRTSQEYLSIIRPLAINGFALIIANGMAGKVGNKYRNEGKVTWGIDWDGEYSASELCRLTPAEYHALPDDRKISKENRTPYVRYDGSRRV